MTVVSTERSPSNSDGVTLSEYAYSRICKALITGQFAPGEKLTLRALAQTLAISPTPIREAVRRLAAENALEYFPNRHICVPKMTVEQLRELRDIRMALEGLAVERATKNLSKHEIDRLCEIDKTIITHRSRGEYHDAVRHIQAFHFSLYRASGMFNLVTMIESLWLRTAPYIMLLFPDYSKRERGTLRSMILEAIGRGDAVAARRYIEADICGALDFIIELVKAKV